MTKKDLGFGDKLERYSMLVQMRAVYKDMLQRLKTEFLQSDTQKEVKQLKAKDGEFDILVTQEAIEKVAGALEKRIIAYQKEIGELD